jgi:hypothetical protein
MRASVLNGKEICRFLLQNGKDRDRMSAVKAVRLLKYRMEKRPPIRFFPL